MHAKSLQLCPTLCNPMITQTPLSMEFYRQEYWSGLPYPPPGDLPNLGIEPTSLMSPALASRFFTTRTTREAHENLSTQFMKSEKKVLVSQSCLTL